MCGQAHSNKQVWSGAAWRHTPGGLLGRGRHRNHCPAKGPGCRHASPQDTCPQCGEKVDLRRLLSDRPWETHNITWIQVCPHTTLGKTATGAHQPLMFVAK